MFFNRLSEVRDITENWLKEYNKQRPHESLGNLTPDLICTDQGRFTMFC